MSVFVEEIRFAILRNEKQKKKKAFYDREDFSHFGKRKNLD